MPIQVMPKDSSQPLLSLTRRGDRARVLWRLLTWLLLTVGAGWGCARDGTSDANTSPRAVAVTQTPTGQPALSALSESPNPATSGMTRAAAGDSTAASDPHSLASNFPKNQLDSTPSPPRAAAPAGASDNPLLLCSDDGKLGQTHRLLLWNGQAFVVVVGRSGASVATPRLTDEQARRLRSTLTPAALRKLGHPKPSRIPDLATFTLHGCWPNVEQRSQVYGTQPPEHSRLFQQCQGSFQNPELESDPASVDAVLGQLKAHAQALPKTDRRRHALLDWLQSLPIQR
jgi:hypothetical protein